jgi:hypothetical protein
MKFPSPAHRALGAAASVVLAACGDAPTTPSASHDELEAIVTDPAPSAPGIFLGSVTPSACAAGSPDTDQDGLADVCETDLAAAFAPQLAYAASDRVGREPRWAARPLTGGRVRVAYLLSLHFDAGLYGCTLGLVLCGGHYGDSETIVLDLYYSSGSRHWVLHQAIYSAHGVYNLYPRFLSAYPSMNFPDRKGGYPRAFLALRKHALYRSNTECDDGELGLDECRADTFQRIATGAARNIGSRSRHLPSQDCVRSAVFTTSSTTECYWTVRAFGGWQGKSPRAGPYSSILSTFGF